MWISTGQTHRRGIAAQATAGRERTRQPYQDRFARRGGRRPLLARRHSRARTRPCRPQGTARAPPAAKPASREVDGSLRSSPKEFPVLAPQQGDRGDRRDQTCGSIRRSKTRCARNCGRCGRPPTGLSRSETWEVAGPFAGRTLVFVHGTFSNSTNMLGEFTATPHGLRFLNGRDEGADEIRSRGVLRSRRRCRSARVINALELGTGA